MGSRDGAEVCRERASASTPRLATPDAHSSVADKQWARDSRGGHQAPRRPPEDLMKMLVRLLAAVAVTLAAVPTFAQQTTGTITGPVLDPQDMAVPGVTVPATNTATGLVRFDVSDAEGLYHLNALPVGTYDVVAELSGFTRLE